VYGDATLLGQLADAVGYTNGQVARRMLVSEVTVRKHLEHIFERLRWTAAEQQSNAHLAPSTRILNL
jgi:DNA-binding NarL/FixJ family response regulator